ncbi:MAG: ABC transporter permease [Actinomycetota bacterium]|nr:ABC transporter permease [Actinomycetota bacterium]MDK1039383.1 ABC transporter permease [Actinomycetota bacterium]
MTQVAREHTEPTEMSDAEALWYSGSWIDRIPQPIAILTLGALMLGTWWLVVQIGYVSRILLPGPAETWDELMDITGNILTGGHVGEALWITTQETILGFLSAAVLGIFLGVVVGETRIGQKAVMPYLVAFNALPKVAFAPVFVAWFGFGINSKIVMALFIAFFPVIVSTAAGLWAVDTDTLMLFKSMEAGRWQTLRKLKLPSALPYIFAGLKAAAVFAVVGAVVGEYLGGGKGMGELIRLASQTLRIDRVFAMIFYLGVLGLLLFGAVALAEKKLLFWQKSDTFDIQGGV